MNWCEKMSLIIGDWLKQQEVTGDNAPHYEWLNEATGYCIMSYIVGDWLKQQEDSTADKFAIKGNTMLLTANLAKFYQFTAWSIVLHCICPF